jgi:hypothetical protein
MREVRRTSELARIVGLRRRRWSDAHAEEMARRLTAELKTPNGQMALRPVQAVALAELRAVRGLLAPIRVGAGKTLISLLAATVLGSHRPVLLVPAKLKAKTERELTVLRRHWRIHPKIVLVSYELLGRADHAELLERLNPDLLVCDEAHRIKNPKAAVSRRVRRWLARGLCVLVAMSGTITRRSLWDYAHLSVCALGAAHAPVPCRWSELEEWSDALDETKGDRTVGVGALERLVGPAEASICDPVARCRLAFRRRLVETPGVVATEERALGTSLRIQAWHLTQPRAVQEALAKLRATWELPDGTPLADALAIWRQTRELALGFWYRWDPPAPVSWLRARKEWCSACREVLSGNHRNLDSELQVARAVDAGHYPKLVGPLARWRAIKDSFVPNPVPEWISDYAIEACSQWQHREKGIVWIEHRAWGDRWDPYYGAQGRNRCGVMIEDADPRFGLGASIASNSEGRNLQAWSKNLITSPPSSGQLWEQLLGRTHRDGQEADEVEATFLVTCPEHLESFAQARRDARYVEQTQGQPQKILYADVAL